MRIAEDIVDTRLTLDVTPLIDIVFLLVLFFAVSTSFISGEDLDALEQDVVTLTESNETLQRRNDALVDDVATARSEVGRLERELGQSSERGRALERIVATLETRRVSLEDSLESADAARKSLEEQVSDTVEAFEALQLRVSGMEQQRSRQAQTEALLRTLLAEREMGAQKLTARLEQSAADARRAAAGAAELDRQLAARAAELERTLGERDRLADQERLLQALLAERAAELEGLKVEIVEAGAELERAAERAARAESALAGLESSSEAAAARHAAEARRLRTEMLTMRNELADYKRVAALDEAQVERVLAAQESLRAGLTADLEDNRVGIEREQHKLVLKLSNQILFDSGSVGLKPDGLAVLGKVGALIRDRIGQLEVQIGGHTDNVPIAGRAGLLATNWGLSAARAVNVVRYLEDEIGIDSRYLSAVGYGEHRPVADNTTAEGRAANRRIEMVLVPRQAP